LEVIDVMFYDDEGTAYPDELEAILNDHLSMTKTMFRYLGVDLPLEETGKRKLLLKALVQADRILDKLSKRRSDAGEE
jgi:hypothetical protein